MPLHRAPSHTVSSATSDYSPTVTFTVGVRLSDSVRVHVDRLTVLAPGDVFEGMGATIGSVTMQALLVVAADSGASANAQASPNGVRKHWTAIAASGVQPVVDSLRMGVPRHVGALDFTLPRPPALDAARSWLVFRVAGASVGTPMRMADGSVVAARIDANGVRVFACAPFNLNGARDRERSTRLAASYTEWC